LLPEFNLLGFNYRMTDLQGAVGLVQLAKLDRLIQERQQWAEYYERELAQVDWLRTPKTPSGFRHGWQSYVCYVDDTTAPLSCQQLMEYLQQEGISARPGTHVVPTLGYYRKRFGFQAGDYPVARDCERNTIAIPLHNQMSAGDYQYVVGKLHALAAKPKRSAKETNSKPDDSRQSSDGK
jgi:dTDP-4-amino-4,6-dideoxygalactose transaminase